nr:MAG TPA: hypothetical protein [Microviridae sp.]
MGLNTVVTKSDKTRAINVREKVRLSASENRVNRAVPAACGACG